MLSRLYGHHVDVIHVQGRVMVVAGAEHQDAPSRRPDLSAARPRVAGRACHRCSNLGSSPASPVHVALTIGGIVAVVSRPGRVFTVIRGQSFAGHALTDIATAGGSAAFLVGVSPLLGFVAFGMLGGRVMELDRHPQARGRDLATGIVLGAAIRLGRPVALCDTTSPAPPGPPRRPVRVDIHPRLHDRPHRRGLQCRCGGARRRHLPAPAAQLGQPRPRRRPGVPVRLVGIGFLVALALAVWLSSLAIGAILSTALLIGPAAIALRLTNRTGVALAAAAAVGVLRMLGRGAARV